MAEPYPPAPPLNKLRLGTIDDVPRIAIVATASFFYSPTFAWERRYHRQYPLDTLQDYEKQFAEFIRDPNSIVLVTEDSYQLTEHTKTEATIALNENENTHKEGDKVIVGVAAWNLAPGSKRVGQFVNKNDLKNKRLFEGGLARDTDLAHSRLFRGLVSREEEKHFAGHFTLERLVVHPAYWRKGHARRLVGWGLELAQLDGVRYGVSTEPSGDGKELYLSMGFVEIGRISTEDEEEPPNKVGAMFLRHI